MPSYSYPGVYVHEVPSGERSVSGAATSITAFVGHTSRGKLNQPIRILNWGDFERIFGGLHPESEVSYAVRQYFLNGGADAYVVRAAKNAQAASVTLKNGVGAGSVNVLALEALSEGTWGNAVRIQVDYATTNPGSLFNLTVTELKPGTAAPAAQETFRNLSMNENSATYAPSVINSSSKLIKATVLATVTGSGYSLSGAHTDPTLTFTAKDRLLRLTVDGESQDLALFAEGGETNVTTVAELASALAEAIAASNGSAAFRATTVAVVGSQVRITSGTPGSSSSVQVSAVAGSNAAQIAKLGLSFGGTEVEAGAAFRPAQNGTASAPITTLSLVAADAATFKVMNGTDELATIEFALGSAPTTLSALATLLQEKLRTSTSARLKNATVRAIGSSLVLQASAEKGSAILTLTEGSLGDKLGLDADAVTANVQWYALGAQASVGAQVAGLAGSDGEAPGVDQLLGSEKEKSGLYALEHADLFNLLCIPRMAQVSPQAHKQILAEAIAYAERRRAFLLVDPPASVKSVQAMQEWIAEAPRHKNAAVYFPHVQVADPLDNFRLKALPPSGTVAGVYARTDAARGIWKVPAGVDATLAGVQGLTVNLTDAENGILNEIGINCLRNFPVYGKVIWGARTLSGADEMASEWKYIGSRRLALFIQESLLRGTKWAVFEGNDEPLWAQVRLSVGSFMNRLFRQGAFQGAPKDAYFVKCDATTTTADDIAQGIVNIQIGFAPLKPAEFVVLNVQQMAAQSN